MFFVATKHHYDLVGIGIYTINMIIEMVIMIDLGYVILSTFTLPADFNKIKRY